MYSYSELFNYFQEFFESNLLKWVNSNPNGISSISVDEELLIIIDKFEKYRKNLHFSKHDDDNLHSGYYLFNNKSIEILVFDKELDDNDDFYIIRFFFEDYNYNKIIHEDIHVDKKLFKNLI